MAKSKKTSDAFDMADDIRNRRKTPCFNYGDIRR